MPIKRHSVFALSFLLSTPAAAQELSLVCDGAMRGMFRDKGLSGLAVDDEGNMVSGSASLSQYREVSTVAQFELVDGKARLNLPQPPTCGICVGEKGWREVRDLEVSANRIAGRIKYGLLSGTRFEIDRRTGRMTSENGFAGTCQAQDLSKPKF